MKILITAGPTYEPLDEVRRLTNFSTGRLGIEMGNYFRDQGHGVLSLCSELVSYTGLNRAQEIVRFSTTAHLDELLRRYGREFVPDVVLHAAAVSDYTVLRASGQRRKVDTGEGEWRITLVPTPKLLKGFREIFPQALLVGWKYELDGTRADVMDKGLRQLRECGTHACVLNGSAYGEGYGILKPDGSLVECRSAHTLYEGLGRLLRREL